MTTKKSLMVTSGSTNGSIPTDPLGEFSNVERPDDVVAEIDVMLSDELNTSLYLLQYPYRPRDQPPYRPDEITAVRFKPEREQLEIELALNTRGANYDRRKSEAIATAANRHGEGTGPTSKTTESLYFPNGIVDRQLLRSSKPIGNGDESNLAVGRFERIRDAEGSIGGKNDGESSGDSKPVTVRFAGRESDRVKAIRARAYSQIVKKNAEEAWLTMGYRDMESPEAEQGRMQMLCPHQHEAGGATTTDNSNIFNVDGSEYASAITNRHAAGLRGDSLKSIREKSLNEQVSYVLGYAKILRFDTLLETLPSGPQAVDRMQVLRAVQQSACLVQGNWVVKSEVLYPKGSRSELLGLSGEIMRRSRNYLLVQLQNSFVVSKSQLAHTLLLPHEELEQLLTQLTVRDGPDRWRLKLPRDEKFLLANPDIVLRQNLIWEALESGLSREFKEARGTTIGDKITTTAGFRRRHSSKVTDPA
ncbi:DNA-directed RNA polymerase III subunit RPC5-like [Tropilaelaps mercedesae]|uniref:DNA-directed RNA polymerase III subunit RPC5-like n=1 Tax=Tropilaelaps mercedesae TaxID=418985 RepID=A0A1V9X3C0_9ACAR|nr:DNA-directed RNA polymerase III subunit RPC5-like [Tropilaelaps mercedesae]